MVSFKEFREMSDSDRKKLKKDDLMEMLTNDDTSQMADLTTAIKELTNLVENFRMQQEKDSVLIVQMKAELELIKDENRALRSEFSSRINNLEQRTRINNIEIVGLRKPTPLETDTALTVDFLNNTVEAGVAMEDIEALHEVPTKRKDGKRIVIAHFKSRAKRDFILAASKEKLRVFNKDLEADQRVYVNEHLSPGNKKLFAMATKKKYELGYKFLWSKNGTIFLKKDPSSLIVYKITSEEDLGKVE